MTTAIIGSEGWVGKSMVKLFPDSVCYDTNGKTASDQEKVNKCDVAFICVPTPNPKNKLLDTSIVESCIRWCECPLIVVRSTINPGDCDRWSGEFGKRIVFQPEYLGETPSHPLIDPRTRPFLVIGGEREDRRKLIELYTTVYNANVTIRQVSSLEAEVIKLSENRAIAFKVAECQELYDACETAGIDYYAIRDAVYGDDPRFNLYWTFIFAGKRGMNSKCIPKDVYAWAAWAESLGHEPDITNGILERNKQWLAQ